MIKGNNDKISVEGGLLRLKGFSCAGGDVEAQEIDLSPYQGQMIRIYLDSNLKLRVNPKGDMYWQLAEMSIPVAAAQTNPGPTGRSSSKRQRSQPGTVPEVLPLILEDLAIQVFDNPA